MVWQKAIRLVVGVYTLVIHFLSIARGSKAELETQLHICGELGFGNKEKLNEVHALCLEVGKMLNRMITTLSPRPLA